MSQVKRHDLRSHAGLMPYGIDVSRLFRGEPRVSTPPTAGLRHDVSGPRGGLRLRGNSPGPLRTGVPHADPQLHGLGLVLGGRVDWWVWGGLRLEGPWKSLGAGR